MARVDEESDTKGSVTSPMWADGKKLAGTPVLRGGGVPVLLSADLTGVKTLSLVVTDGADGFDFDHADWAGATITLKPGSRFRSKPLAPAVEATRMVYQKPVRRPEIHNPSIVGCTPGKPCLFLISATGKAPLRYAASGPPGGPNCAAVFIV